MTIIDTTTSIHDASAHNRRVCDSGNPSAPDGSCDDLVAVYARLNAGDDRMTRIEGKIDNNNTDTAEILDILRLGKSFFRIIGYFGSFMKWFAAIAAPVIVLWYTVKNGGKL